MKKNLAIIGSGISGIASAYYLRNDYNITIFEKENYLGGHTNTVTIEEEKGKPVPIDTGFIVYNKATYPQLTKFFEELQVETEESNMSFSLYNLDSNLQFCGAGISGVLAQKSNAFRFKYWRFVAQILRFFKTSTDYLNSNENNLSLGDYLKKQRYTKYFIENYIIPMSSAIWSTPMEKMMDFPARTLIQFFQNHGLLGVNSHHQWRTVTRGSHNYIHKIKEKIKAKIHLNSPVVSVTRDSNGAVVCTKENKYKFDKVLIAAHADQALRMLKNPSPLEQSTLSCFSYQKNEAILHCEEKAMPPLRKVWSAWNYKIKRIDNEYATTTIYYMNRLQNLKTEKEYFVSVNELAEIPEEKILYRIMYEHPLFDLKAIDAQKFLPQLQQNNQVFFCGSYFNYGFHEDGLCAAIQASDILKKQA